MIALALLQAAIAGPLLDRPTPVTSPKRACGQPESDAPDAPIVVCARPGEQFRLRPLPERYSADAAALPKAETSILGGRAALAGEAEQADVGGFTSNRAMVRIKVPF